MKIEERIANLKRQLGQLTDAESAVAAQLDAVRSQRLRCEGALQYVQAMAHEIGEGLKEAGSEIDPRSPERTP